jgi:hypothetical protein
MDRAGLSSYRPFLEVNPKLAVTAKGILSHVRARRSFALHAHIVEHRVLQSCQKPGIEVVSSHQNLPCA